MKKVNKPSSNRYSKKNTKGGDTHSNIPSIDDLGFSPLEVKVHNNFEKAFKAFRALVQAERLLSLYKEKQAYEKPSDKKRRKRNEMRKRLIELEIKQKKIISGEYEKEKLKKQTLKDQRRKDRNDKHRASE